MKILVTGGAGYIGSHVNRLLNESGHQTVVIDNLSTGRAELVIGGKLFKGDISDIKFVEKVLVDEKVEAVFHFAGSIIVPESVQDPIKYYKNNTENALNLINLCLKLKIHKFIFSSTAAVYGVPSSSDGMCSEDSQLKPINPYGKSKLMTEWMLEDVSDANPEFKYVAIRYFNVAGASKDGKLGQCSPVSTHLIKIASEVVAGKRAKMAIYGEDYPTPDGTCIRDYIHVEDLALAHLDALNYLNKGKPSVAVNCGYSHGASVKEIINIARKVSGINFTTDMSSRREGDSPILIAKSEKIRSLFGWQPRYDNLELIVKSAMEWERNL